MAEPDDVRAAGEVARLAGRAVRRLAAALRRVCRDPRGRRAEERDRLKAFLADNDLYLYTVNAFPYGPFKGVRVKEQVYEPDWRSEERTRYTINVADVLADVGAPGMEPSIQTAPLGFKPNVTGPDVVDAYTEHVLRVAAHLVDLERRTGATVTLAIEPEPYCFLETTDETVAYFAEHLYSGAAASRLGELAGIPVSEAHMALRRHLGIVFDICHQAVEYEDIPTSLGKLVDAGIPILKLQEAAALQIPLVTDEIVEVLRRYAETIYLTQTLEVQRREADPVPQPRGCLRGLGGGRPQPARVAGPHPRAGLPRRPRRVPLHPRRDRRRPSVSTRRARSRPSSRSRPTRGTCCPDELKTGDIVEYVCREIEWVRGELVPAGEEESSLVGAPAR